MDCLAGRLLAELEAITRLMDELLDASIIDWVEGRARRLARQTRVMVSGLPDGQWGPSDEKQLLLQRRLLEHWRPWLEMTQLLFSEDTAKRQKEILAAARATEAWLERSSRCHDIPSTIPEAKKIFRKKVEPLKAALTSLMAAPSRVVAVPDTNVLLRSPDITTYAGVLETDAFVVLLVPAVLHELDEHKVNHRNPEVREKARKFTTRIKGWRAQGNLSEGVKVQGTVFVRVEGREPNFEKTLSWLQRDVADDRILASLLEVQRRAPNDRVVLLTGDTAMLAKADAARVPTVDTPEPDL